MAGRETSRDTTDCLDQRLRMSVSSDPFHTTLGSPFRETAPKDDIGARQSTLFLAHKLKMFTVEGIRAE